MTSKVESVPKGYHTITPTLTVKGADRAIEFYKKAFKAQEIERHMGPDGKTIMHAELKIGNSIFMLNDEFPRTGCQSPQSLGGTPVTLYVYIEDVDTWFKRAVDEGAKVTMPLNDMFWGDRVGQVTDPFGHKWNLATHIKDMTPEEMKRGQEEWQKQQMAMGKK